MICAALADRPTTVLLDTWSKDMEATLNVVTAMGAKAHWVDTNHLRIDPIDEIPATATLDCGESGSTLRFLFPVAAALGSNGFTFTGRGKLPQLPWNHCVPKSSAMARCAKGQCFPMTNLRPTPRRQLHTAGRYQFPIRFRTPFCSSSTVGRQCHSPGIKTGIRSIHCNDPVYVVSIRYQSRTKKGTIIISWDDSNTAPPEPSP